MPKKVKIIKGSLKNGEDKLEFAVNDGWKARKNIRFIYVHNDNQGYVP